jgi:hypothetical protein
MPTFKHTSSVALSLSSLLASATLTPALAAPAQPSGQVDVRDHNISMAQVIEAQKNWCAGLLKISQAYASGGIKAATTTAEAVIDQAYAYQYGPVAFKPTLTSGSQTFRATREGALAYFVGNNPRFPNDKGFALKPWRTCRAVNAVIQLNGPSAVTMGNVILTDAKGDTTKVDKTWKFEKESNGTIRILLHHSSLPFQG